MAKFHISKDGTARRCSAKNGKCPYRDTPHYETLAEATEAAEQKLAAAVKPKILSKKIIQRRMYSRTSRTLVLSDVDGTLVNGSLVLEHAVYLHERGIVDLGDLPDRWNADQKNEELITDLATAYKSSLENKKISEIDVPDYMTKVMEAEKFYSALERLKRHRDAGHDVVLISGSPTFLVGEFAEKFGFKAVGSTYHMDRTRRFNGRVTGMFGADAKAQVVQELKPEDYDLVVAYGDTASDKPLLDVAHHSVLVAPTEETLEKVTKVDEILHN